MIGRTGKTALLSALAFCCLFFFVGSALALFGDEALMLLSKPGVTTAARRV